MSSERQGNEETAKDLDHCHSPSPLIGENVDGGEWGSDSVSSPKAVHPQHPGTGPEGPALTFETLKQALSILNGQPEPQMHLLSVQTYREILSGEREMEYPFARKEKK